MNVHPFPGELADAQIEALRSLGIRKVRISLGLHEDLAGRYLPALGALGAEVVGLVDDFERTPPEPSAWPSTVRRVVGRAPGLFGYEILNEPLYLSPEAYVRDYLRPAYEIVKSVSPSSPVVAGAPSSTIGGREYFFRMTEAGADSWCDYRAAHIYNEHPENYVPWTGKPFLVTESGVADPALHVDWWSRVMKNMSGVLGTDRVYWYALADSEDDGFAVISRHSRPGAIVALSPLYQHLRGKAGGWQRIKSLGTDRRAGWRTGPGR